METVRETKRTVEWKVTDFDPENFYTEYSPDFHAAEHKWQIELHKSSSEITIAVSKYNNFSKLPFPILYSLGLKTREGKSEEKVSGILDGDKCRHSHEESFIQIEELLRRKTELLPSDTLTVTCTMEKSESSNLTNLNLLSENVKSLFTSSKLSDVTLNVMDKEFKAHKSILAARSPVFDSYFTHDSLEKVSGVVNIPDCDSESFPDFLNYLYSGKIEKISFRTAVHVYKTADKYNVEELKKFCVEYMTHNLSMDNFYTVLSLAELHDDDTNLLAAVNDFFSDNFGEISVTDEWKNLMRSNSDLANKLFIGTWSSFQVVSKRRRLE